MGYLEEADKKKKLHHHYMQMYFSLSFTLSYIKNKAIKSCLHIKAYWNKILISRFGIIYTDLITKLFFFTSMFYSFVNLELRCQPFILQSTDRLSGLESQKLFQKHKCGEIKGETNKYKKNHDNFNK